MKTKLAVKPTPFPSDSSAATHVAFRPLRTTRARASTRPVRGAIIANWPDRSGGNSGSTRCAAASVSAEVSPP